MSDDTFPDLRNFVIIKKEITEAQETGQWVDPRSIYYLGNACRGLELNAEAIALYTEFMEISGNPDDIFSSMYYNALIYANEKVRRPMDAYRWFQQCVALRPQDPRGYFGMARCCYLLGKYRESMHWYSIGRQLPEPRETLHTYNPLHITLFPHQIAALALKELGDRDGAVRVISELEPKFRGTPHFDEIAGIIGNWIAALDLAQGVRVILANSQPKHPKESLTNARKIIEVLPAIPDELEKTGIGKKEPDDTRGGHPLMIWCGPSWEPWGPRSGAAGIGGSEKAVIQMAPRLQARGFAVTVYGDVPRDQRGIDSKTGVNWQHFASFDYERPRGTAIFWRAPAMLEIPIPAEKRIVWCHDVQDPNQWTPVRCALAYHVCVLSEFHKKTLGVAAELLGNKVVVTRNGIDSTLFRTILSESLPRNPNRIVYASSPDRGVPAGPAPAI